MLPKGYHLVLAGPKSIGGAYSQRDDAYFDSLRTLIQDSGLENRVTLIPEYVSSENFIPLADYYLAFSVSEGLGTTILEAIASEVCVLANNMVPSYQQFIQHTQGSYLVPMNESAVKDKIKGIDSHSKLLELKNDRSALYKIASFEIIKKGYKDIFR